MLASGFLSLVLTSNWALFLWDIYLDWRQYNVHKAAKKRPAEIEGLITEEEFTKARNYKLDKHVFGFVHSIADQLYTTVVLLGGYLPWLWYACDSLPLRSAAFVVISGLIHTFVFLPFELYDTFVIEENHGFNKQTLQFYFLDQIKKQIVNALITSPIILVVEWIVNNGGPYFFVYVWLMISVIILLLMTIYPAFIAPLFDKYIPLPDGQLKTAIEALAASLKFPLTKLYVVHGSKRSSHSNAYMYGFWKNKRIVLYDTLLSGDEKQKVHELCDEAGEEVSEKDKQRGMSNDEVVAVLGHELGHWALSHTMINLIIAEVNIFLMLFVFAKFYRWELMYEAFGFHDTPVIIGLTVVLSYIMGIYNKVSEVLLSMLSRRLEFSADRFAAELGHGEKLCTALIKLGKDNLSLPIDDHLYSMCNHSHPPIPERIAAIKSMKLQ